MKVPASLFGQFRRCSLLFLHILLFLLEFFQFSDRFLVSRIRFVHHCFGFLQGLLGLQQLCGQDIFGFGDGSDGGVQPTQILGNRTLDCLAKRVA